MRTKPSPIDGVARIADATSSYKAVHVGSNIRLHDCQFDTELNGSLYIIATVSSTVLEKCSSGTPMNVQ